MWSLILQASLCCYCVGCWLLKWHYHQYVTIRQHWLKAGKLNVCDCMDACVRVRLFVGCIQSHFAKDLYENNGINEPSLNCIVLQVQAQYKEVGHYGHVLVEVCVPSRTF